MQMRNLFRPFYTSVTGSLIHACNQYCLQSKSRVAKELLPRVTAVAVIALAPLSILATLVFNVLAFGCSFFTGYPSVYLPRVLYNFKDLTGQTGGLLTAISTIFTGSLPQADYNDNHDCDMKNFGPVVLSIIDYSPYNQERILPDDEREQVDQMLAHYVIPNLDDPNMTYHVYALKTEALFELLVRKEFVHAINALLDRNVDITTRGFLELQHFGKEEKFKRLIDAVAKHNYHNLKKITEALERAEARQTYLEHYAKCIEYTSKVYGDYHTRAVKQLVHDNPALPIPDLNNIVLGYL